MDEVLGIGELISSIGASTGERIAETSGHHESTGCCANELQRKLVQPRKQCSEEVIFKLNWRKNRSQQGITVEKVLANEKCMCESSKAEKTW